MVKQKIKGAINSGGFGGRVLALHLLKQIIGFSRAMALPNQAEDVFALGGEAA